MSDVRDVFTEVYEQNTWANESRSGAGSSAAAAANIIREIPLLLKSIEVTSMLDVPCGDFMWMREVDLGVVHYTGADTVAPLIEANQAAYGSDSRRFLRLDLMNDPLPQVDLILCRDCFLHLTVPMIFAALRNIAASPAKWLLTSSYLWRGFPNNQHIDEVMLGGRRINLELEPFYFQPPRRTIPENEVLDFCADKCLCLWRMEDVRAALATADLMSRAKVTGKSAVTRGSLKT
jgi:hypothetical protein